MKIKMGFISNSSSEAFICKTEKTIPEITEILKDMLKQLKTASDSKEAEISPSEEYLEYFSNIPFERIFKEPRLCTQKDYKLLLDYDVDLGPAGASLVVIYSYEDNSIPWVLFERIEEEFEAYRVHLG